MKIFNVQLNHQPNTISYSPQRAGMANSLLMKGALNRDTVSFGNASDGGVINQTQADISSRVHSFNSIESIPDLPCVYCGEPMLARQDKIKLIHSVAHCKGEKLAEVLHENKYLRGVKVNVAEKICTLAKKYPNDNIQDLFVRLAPQYIQELETEQLSILRKIGKKYSNAFDTTLERTIFQRILYDTTQWINNEDESKPFKRKEFLRELKNILYLPVFRNRNVVQRIMADAEQMPQSFESESAFVVKYHRRSPQEIATQFFYESGSTREHIKTKTSGGPAIPENLSLACAYCNNFVRNNVPMDKFVDAHPEIENNIRKNLNAILAAGSERNTKAISIIQSQKPTNPKVLEYIEKLKASSGCGWYTSAIAKQYMAESKGKLHLEEYLNKEPNDCCDE